PPSHFSNSKEAAHRLLLFSPPAPNAASFGCNFSEIGARWVEIHSSTTAPAPIRVINEVESFGTELKAGSLGNRERLEQSKIPVLKSRLIDQIAHTLCVERTVGRFGKNGRVKPVSARAKSPNDFRRSINNPILAIHSAPKVGVQAYTSIIMTLRDAARQTGLELRNAADLPAPEQLPGHRRMILEEREVVKIVEHQDVARIEFRRPP